MITIEKNGKRIMELSREDGCFSIVKRCENGGAIYYVISAEEFANILDRAYEGGYDVFDFDF